MKVILIVSDTLRRDHLGLYGSNDVKTPNLDRFAGHASVFDRAYCASFPTVPHRTDVMTGRYTFTHGGWQALQRDAVTLPGILAQAGCVTMFVGDTPHIFQHGFNFDRDFTAWDWIRGQTVDRLRTDPIHVNFPCAREKVRSADTTASQHVRNTALRQFEEDWSCAKVATSAAHWLERNYMLDDFFLWVDMFDPHEPWDPPQWYVDMYDPGYTGEVIEYPLYDKTDFLSPEELNHVHARYCGEVTLVDFWVGQILRKLEVLGIYEEAAIIFTTDHGFCFGERGYLGKSVIRSQYQQYIPLYDEIAHIPFIVKTPGQKEQTRPAAFVQPVDITATVLEFFGEAAPEQVHGKSVIPVLEGKANQLHDFAVSSPSLWRGANPYARSTVTTDHWTFMYGSAETELPLEYQDRIVDGIPRKHVKLVDQDVAPMLFDNRKDPGQLNNVYSEHKDVARRIHSDYIRFLEELGTPEDNLASRRTLPA